jgi:hypothetical protein
MLRPYGRSLVLLLLTLLSTRTCLTDNNISLNLTLPPELYAVPGVEMSIYYDSIVLTQNPEQYRFHGACDIGQSEARRWTVTPKPADVGAHELTVSVSDANGQRLEEASLMLTIAPSDAGAGGELHLLIVGDSLTHGTAYPNEMQRPTHRSASVSPRHRTHVKKHFRQMTAASIIAGVGSESSIGSSSA